MNGQQQQGQQIQIKIDDATMKGVYTNNMLVSHSKEEFVLDFMNVYPLQNAGIVSARVITSPGHAKRILGALKENIEKYEKSFGTIEVAKAPAQNEIGFRG